MIKKLNQPKFLYVATEHGKSLITGGIGSYIEEVHKLSPEDVIVLVAINDNKTKKSDRDWLVLNDFFDAETIESTNFLVVVAKAIQKITQKFSSLQKIEIQEYFGIATILLHLQRNDLFYKNILILVHCHGSARYIENNNTSSLKPDKIEQVYAEKVAIELTENLRFPTNFLYQSYLNFDYNISPNSVLVNRYPFNFPHLKFIPYKQIDTLIFFGKRNAMKGYKEFAAAIQILSSRTFFTNRIKKIVLLGPVFDYPKENLFFKELANSILIEELSLTREKSLAFIQNHANHALCVLPYRGDNHPVSVLEVVSLQCPIIAADAGGIPELIPERFHQELLFKVSASALATKIEKYLTLEKVEIEFCTTSLFTEMSKTQVNINNNQFFCAQNKIDIVVNFSVNIYNVSDNNTSIDELIANFELLNCDFIVLSKVALSTVNIEKITKYINDNVSIEAGIIAANPLDDPMSPPILGDGLPALFLNKNYILSKVIYISKSRLLSILAGFDKTSKIDTYFIINLIIAFKKDNNLLGVVYLEDEVGVYCEDLLDNDSYKLLLLFSELGLNKFDSDRVYKLLSFSGSNGNSMFTKTNKQTRNSIFFRLKRKLNYLFSKLN